MQSIQRNPGVIWREETDALGAAQAGLDHGDDVGEIGTAILFLEGVMLSINILGMEIWKLCDGRDLEELVAALLQEFDVAEEVLRSDVRAFLGELRQKGFVTYVE